MTDSDSLLDDPGGSSPRPHATPTHTTPWKPGSSDIFNYIKRHGWKITRARVQQAVKSLRANHKTNPNAKNVSISQSAADWQVIYGRVQTGGVITYANLATDHSKMMVVVTVAGHEIDAVEKIFVNDVEIKFDPDFGWCTGPNLSNGINFTHKIFAQVNLGTDDQAAFSQLITDTASLSGKWTSTDKQSGRAGVYLKFLYDESIFPDGAMPEVYFQLRGKKCYDPRSETTYWTQNAALCIADYLMDPDYGSGVQLSEIDTASLGAAADTCDIAITNADGSIEGKYTVDGAFDSKEGHQNVLGNMCSAMGGIITDTDLWRFWPAQWRDPVITITEDDILSEVNYTPLISRKESFNQVRGVYNSSAYGSVDSGTGVSSGFYEATDFPTVKNALYLSQDNNEESVHDLSLPFTVSPPAAQRLAKIELERSRQQIQVEFTAKLSVFQVMVPENVHLTLSRQGWAMKPFEVQECSLVIENQGDGPFFAVKLTLRESIGTVFEWNNGEETTIDLSPNTYLPSPFTIYDPTDLVLDSGTDVLYQRLDGTIASALLASWTSPADAFVTSGGKIAVQYKKSADESWLDAPGTEGDQTAQRILDVQDGVAYDVRIRSVNGLGTKGNWVYAYNHVVLGKSLPPSDVQGFTASVHSYGIDFAWSQIPDLDLAGYEVREGTDWDTGVPVIETKGTGGRLNFRAAGTTTFLMKAVDTSGNYSTNAASAVVTIAAPSAPIASFSLQGTDLVIEWADSSADFAIDRYQISQGADYSTASVIGTTKGTTFRKRVDWGGTQDFWVAAIDVAGNVGSPFHVVVTITPPGIPQSLTALVVDNHAFLKWAAPLLGSLPLAGYSVYKGDTYPPIDGKIGDVTGTFEDVMETAAGVYTYWVVGEDTAANMGPPANLTLRLAAPPDFVLLQDRGIDPRDAYVASNIYIEGVGYLVIGSSGDSGGGTPIGILAGITGSGGGTGSGSPTGLLAGITNP